MQITVASLSLLLSLLLVYLYVCCFYSGNYIIICIVYRRLYFIATSCTWQPRPCSPSIWMKNVKLKSICVSYLVDSVNYHTDTVHGYNSLWISATQYVTLAVRACSDVHLALTSTVGNITRGREIVIGGYSNTRSQIINGVRDDGSSFGGAVVAQQETPLILSCTELRMFWISWIGDLIEVGTGWELGTSGFMRWHDPAPIAIAALGVSTGYAHDGDWRLTHTRGLILE